MSYFSRIAKSFEVLSYLWKKHRVLAIVGILAFALSAGTLLNHTLSETVSTTQSILDGSGIGNALTGAFSFMTLVVACLVYWNQTNQDWESSLPRRLWAEFVADGEVVMVCEDASHIDDGDARSLAMQIGRQMSGGDLKLSPMFDFIGPEVVQTNAGWIRRSRICIHLADVPTKISEHRQADPIQKSFLLRRMENEKWIERWQPTASTR